MFDAAKFLSDHFGSAQGVIGLFSAYGLRSPEIEAVRKWFSRASIPSEWLPVLVALLEIDCGQPVRLSPYINSAGGEK